MRGLEEGFPLRPWHGPRTDFLDWHREPPSPFLHIHPHRVQLEWSRLLIVRGDARIQTGVHRCSLRPMRMAKNPPENHRPMVSVFGLFWSFQEADQNLLFMARL